MGWSDVDWGGLGGWDASSTAAASWNDQILSYTPEAYWRMDDASGITLTDSSGNGEDMGISPSGVTYSVASLIPSDANVCMTVDGVTNTMELVGTGAQFTVSSFSIGLTVSADSRADFEVLMMKTTNNTWRAGGWGIHWESTDKLKFWVDDYLVNFVLSGALSLTTTYNLVLTYDNVTLRGYIDGVEFDNFAVAGAGMGTGNVFLGMYGLGTKFAGDIDEAFYIGSTLTPAQVLALHTASQ